MAKIKIFALLLGVVIAGVVHPGQSEEASTESAGGSSEVGERRIDVPEVVLQLKYNKGELNKIYLTQFRKDASRWSPSVPAKSNLCSDLCHAGLGGEVCGSSCSQLVPVGLHLALQQGNGTEAEYGHPRYTVCPALCNNHLGEPLCNCASEDVDVTIDWAAVCAAFCLDGYTPNGCPTCDTSTSEAVAHASRILTTSEGWAAWCNVQCKQGQGGAACNCDRAPFQ